MPTAEESGDAQRAAEGSAGDAAEDSPTDADSAGPEDLPETGPTTGGGSREVVVPESLFKVVTVFSTLLSIVFVVAGFGTLGAATQVVRNPPGSLVGQVLVLAGVPTPTVVDASSTVGLVVGLLGLALVAGGAAVYVYGSRFRAPGMGKPKDEADEGNHDG